MFAHEFDYEHCFGFNAIDESFEFMHLESRKKGFDGEWKCALERRKITARRIFLSPHTAGELSGDAFKMLVKDGNC